MPKSDQTPSATSDSEYKSPFTKRLHNEPTDQPYTVAEVKTMLESIMAEDQKLENNLQSTKTSDAATSAAIKKHHIIFLDIDGVIFPYSKHRVHDYRIYSDEYIALREDEKLDQYFKEHYGSSVYSMGATFAFDERAIDFILKLCKEFDAKIVISSDWRIKRTLQQIKKLLGLWGLDEYIIDITPKLIARAEEVERWLILNNNKVKSFVAIDDDLSDFKERLPYNFAHCVSDKGFAEEEFQEAQNILTKAQPIFKRDIFIKWHNLTQKKSVDTLTLNLETSSVLCRYLGITRDILFARLSTMLENSDVSCKRLNVNDIKYYGDKPTAKELGLVLSKIIKNTPSITQLDLSFSCIDFNPILKVLLNGKNSLEYLGLETNIGCGDAEYRLLAELITITTRPFTVNLKSESKIPDFMLDACAKNSNIKIYAYDKNQISENYLNDSEFLKNVEFYKAKDKSCVIC